MPAGEHKRQQVSTVSCAVVTVSDTRTEADDASGALIRELLTEAGHRVRLSVIVRDDPERIREVLTGVRDDPSCEAVLMTGGTGLAPRDVTHEVVSGLLDKRLDGFGELFRGFSFAEIGPAAMLSRAVAGVMGSTVVFAMPGSTAAVRLAMERLVLPELPHVVYLLSGKQ
ncbi:MAG: MogA/MoaB family molybdenum cofactor biosynthesis protein [Phycisphaerales bacterium]|nr:MogA/MoaB family molybdenum cofactor biosynthesis protein [Phycisphaerales bacterium]